TMKEYCWIFCESKNPVSHPVFRELRLLEKLMLTKQALLRKALSLVTMAEGIHAFPSRTRPLSPPAPMVLDPQGSGRVGRCQANKKHRRLWLNHGLRCFFVIYFNSRFFS